MKILVTYENTENSYEIGVMKLIDELGIFLTEQQIKEAVVRILNRE